MVASFLQIAGAGLTSALCVSAYTYSAYNPQSHLSKQYSQEFTDAYSVLKHFGGNGPWSQGVGYGIERDAPQGCSVDQVVMIHRHGERYPSTSDWAAMVASQQKVYDANITSFKGDLAFLNEWEPYLTPDNVCLAEQETFSGPYAGLLSAYTLGTEYRARYGHLWDGGSVVPFWSSGYERVIETARQFGKGFFQYNYSTAAALNIISESEDQGANSLTPSCDVDNSTAICDALTNYLPQFDVAAARLNAQNPGLELNSTDIYNLMEMAAFELNVRAFSKWIGAFTLDEWVAYGYTQDLQYYYCSGPGDKNMNAVGAVFLNATVTLLNQGPSNGSLFWNFAHDTNITPIIGLLGIFSPPKDLPTDRVAFPNLWSTGNIVPQSGHLTIERLTCNETALSAAGTYVRLVSNDAVIPWQHNTSGPGYSAPLDDFTSTITKTLPNYISQCHVNSTYPQYFDLWWNYNTSTALNYQQGPIACALTTTET